MTPIYFDIETYCELDLRKVGVHAYCTHPSFRILLIAFAVGDGDVTVYDVAKHDGKYEKRLPVRIKKLISDGEHIKIAHNAAFEMACLRSYGADIKYEDWQCTMNRAARLGHPVSLSNLANTLGLKEGKLSTGKSLIQMFSKPHKGRRIFPDEKPEEWEEFKRYNQRDVDTLRSVDKSLGDDITSTERAVEILDWKINDLGVSVDTELASRADSLAKKTIEEGIKKLKELTGLDNPNSTLQFSTYLKNKGYPLKSVTKENLRSLLLTAEDKDVKAAIRLRLLISKASLKKYEAVLRTTCQDGRIRGMFRYYGAATGRWTGRLVQLQNLKKNSIKDIALARALAKEGDAEAINLAYKEDITEVLGQLIRTVLLPTKGGVLTVSDFSSVEARVLAWLASETWKEKVFKQGGDIYKESYSKAFGVPVEAVTKGMRSKGKIMELALGYGGSDAAMIAFGADKLGLSAEDITKTVKAWRRANANITRLWTELNAACIDAAEDGLKSKVGRLTVGRAADSVYIELPSKRKLYYRGAKLGRNRFGGVSMTFLNEKGREETYGGKLVENATQAVARDLLAEAMLRIDKRGLDIVAHVHDEVLVDADAVKEVEACMKKKPAWADGLYVDAESYTCSFYYKE